jgi:hypothetical protein
MRFEQLVLGNPRPFAVCYTFGNILSVGSSLFLVGVPNARLDHFAKPCL